ncbi:MAG: alpha/beta fold hydrolase [Bacteroidota bacterium]
MSQSPSVIYLLSGNGSTKAWWEDCLSLFQQRQPIPLELPGFGDNPSDQYQSVSQLSEALLEMTEAGSEIFAVGVNGLIVLHALVRKPGHFSRVSLLAPVGAFLWERRFVKFMSLKPIRMLIHFLLRNRPTIFARKFSSQRWTQAQYERMGEGYRKCRAFQRYFELFTAEDALDFFDRIETPIELIWGTRDAVLDQAQVVAWDSILPRAELTITIKDNWGHYPYIDDPQEFASYLDDQPLGFRAHSKGGRLQLAALGKIPVPKLWTVQQLAEYAQIEAQLSDSVRYALRSSDLNEDQIDGSQAGKNETYLRVAKADIRPHLKAFFEGGMAQVVIQEFVEPRVSGVAFVRRIAAEVEWVAGHLEALLSGQSQGNQLVLTDLGADWGQSQEKEYELAAAGVSARKLQTFLQEVIRLFHYQHADIEWAWDGKQFWLLQLRPVTAHSWRRCLTSANLDEILPKRVSRLMEEAQRLASPHIGRVMGRWDENIFREQEPFSVVYQDASYINSDLFLARFHAWGLPSAMYAAEIGGAVPKIPLRPFRFLRHLPVFLKMGFAGRGALKYIPDQLAEWEQELVRIEQKVSLNGEAKEAALVRWFCRYYVFIVRTNILINMAVSTSLGSFLSRAKTVYGEMQSGDFPHRLAYESDPATPRPKGKPLPLTEFPQWSSIMWVLHAIGVPGLRGRYLEVREWFRDNNMRLFHRLHQAMQDSDWLELHPGTRSQQGTFWQDGGAALRQDFSFMIYPGKVSGILGEDILLVDALEPGHFSHYQQAKGVISRSGGRLSHGATLLRELQKPSAVLSEVDESWIGEAVVLEDGTLRKT